MKQAPENIRSIDAARFPSDAPRAKQIRFLLRYAILAPSTHNIQPWRFAISGDSCAFHFDPRLRLPQADPTGRDLFISIGCCIENFIVAAMNFGVPTSLRYCHDHNTCVAEIAVGQVQTPLTTRELLFPAITERVNYRGPFSPRAFPEGLTDELMRLNDDPELSIACFTEAALRENIADSTARGLRMAHRSGAFRREFSRWVTSNMSSRRDGIPGYAIGLPNTASRFFPFFVALRDFSAVFAPLNKKAIQSAPLIILVNARHDNKDGWVRSGRLIQRLLLALSVKGIRTSIFAAAIEYKTLTPDILQRVPRGFAPQLLFCAGYSEIPWRTTPRRRVEEKLL